MKNYGKWVFQALVLSIGLNIIFLFLFYAVVFRKDIYKVHFSGSMISKNKNKVVIADDIMSRLEQLTLFELFPLLDSNEMVCGYPLKQLVVGAAATFHQIDITRAVSHPLIFSEVNDHNRVWEIPVNLDNTDYAHIKSFLCIEKLPYTTRGLFRFLFKELEEGSVTEDALLAFCHTSEFIYLRALMAGAEEQVSSVFSLARMVISGGEELFFSLCGDAYASVSTLRRIEVLKAYVDAKFSLAALCLLVHDGNYVFHHFSDTDLNSLLALLPEESTLAQNFISRVKNSIRWGGCDKRVVVDVQEFKGSDDKVLYDYKVQEGDSLWLISRKFGVSIDRIIQINQLKNTIVHPGVCLKIPAKKS